jgi:hypothetical protein
MPSSFLIGFFILLSSVVFPFVFGYGQDCSNQTSGWSDFCYNVDNDAPYCIRSNNNSAQLICVECQTDCDCDIHEFCSRNPNVNLDLTLSFLFRKKG